MASNFVVSLFGSIPIILVTKQNFGWLEEWKVGNGLQFPDFTTMAPIAYYINLEGHGHPGF